MEESSVKRAMVMIDPVDLAAVLEENLRLRERVTELQTAASEKANGSLGRRVRAFMQGTGQPVRWEPDVPADAEVRLRARIVAEEFAEMMAALFEASDANNWTALVRSVVDRAPVKVDMEEFVDALADLDYVVEGARASFGINGDPIATEVHRANMAKLDGGTLRPDGKFLKPAGWTPPDIRRVLWEQGWRP